MISFKNIINMSRASLMKVGRGALRSMYTTLAKKSNKIVNQFAKNNRTIELPYGLEQTQKSNKMTNEELINAIGDMSNFFLTSKYKSYSAWRKDYDEKKAKYRDLMNKKRVSDAEYDEYRSFMNDMYYMHKNSMEPSDLYNESNYLWLQSQRLNLNPYQFSENLEKWNKRLETLSENVSNKEIIVGDDLDLEVYEGVFKKVASWLKD